ncbi:hypothetical protein D3C73_856540 [compost metagenome]
MQAGHRQDQVRHTHRRHDAAARRADVGQNVFGVDVQPRLQAKAQHAARFGQRVPDFRIRLVAGVHGNAVVRQRGDGRAVLVRHRFHGVHEFLVFALRVGHQRNRGRRHGGQLGDFARMVHA